MRSSVGTRIRREREALGISARKLAKLVNVAPSTITRWESGEHDVPITPLRAIAAALGVTLSRLSGETLAQQTSTSNSAA